MLKTCSIRTNQFETMQISSGRAYFLLKSICTVRKIMLKINIYIGIVFRFHITFFGNFSTYQAQFLFTERLGSIQCNNYCKCLVSLNLSYERFAKPYTIFVKLETLWNFCTYKKCITQQTQLYSDFFSSVVFDVYFHFKYCIKMQSHNHKQCWSNDKNCCQCIVKHSN